MRKCYVVLSNPNTFISKNIRRFGSYHYAHASLAMDEKLTEMYSFARIYKHAFVPGGPVKENGGRLLNHISADCNVKIVTIELSDEQYQLVQERIEKVFSDPEYIYNLASIPFVHMANGLKVYKAYTCSEFVCTMLSDIVDGLDTYHAQSFSPDDLDKALENYPYYQGSLRAYLHDEVDNTNLYKPTSIHIIPQLMIFIGIVIIRSLFKRIK